MGSINTGNFGRFIPQAGQTPAPQDVSGGMFEAGQRLGDSVQNVAAGFIVDARRKQHEVDRETDASAVFAARRKLDDWERANVYDPQNGAIAKRGADAFGLPQTLPKAFDDSANEIGKDLTNPRQRIAYAEVTNSRRNQIGAFADRHALQERRTYDEGQYQADVTSSLNRAALVASTGDTAASATEVAIAQTRTTGYLRSLGKSEEEIAGAVRSVSSKASVTTINLLLDQDLPMKADEYLKANAGAMNIEDLLRTKMAVSKAVDARVGLTVANDIIKGSVMPALAPSDTVRLSTLAGAVDFGRLNDAKRQAESGNRDLNKDGSVVTSPKGAKGRDQVMDSTNTDPGYGVTPARDNSLAERSRVGTDYLAAMLREYKGDVPKALAAYNAGPGRLNQEIKDAAKRGAPDAWLSNMPAETRAYVATVSKKYAAGGGAPELPSLQALHQQVRDRVGLDSPQRLKTALDDVSRQYDDMLKGKKQTEEKAEADTLQWLADNKGNFAGLPNELRQALPPGKIDNAMTFAGKIAAGVPVTTDWETYTQLRSMAVRDPQKFASTDLRQFYGVLGTTQRESMLDLQTSLNDPKKQPSIRTLAQQLGVAHDLLGLKGEKQGKFDDAVSQAVAGETREKKRELTFEENDKIIKRMMLPTNLSWYQSGPSHLYKAAGTSAEGAAKPELSSENRKLISAALKSEGKDASETNIIARFNLRYGIK